MTAGLATDLTTGTGLRIRRLSARFGAEVSGVTLSGRLSGGLVEDLKDALFEHKVLTFRGQHLTTAQHAGLLDRFGPVSAPDLRAPDHGEWVATDSFRLSPPKIVSFRPSGPVPPGATAWFADAAGAYRDLPRPLRSLADSARALHGPIGGHDVVAHPVTRLHPETGDRTLLLGTYARRVVGLDDTESRTVLRLLRTHLDLPGNVLRWSWRTGDVLLVDARAVFFRRPGVGEGVGEGETAEPVVRLTVAGDRPLGVDGQHSRPAA